MGSRGAGPPVDRRRDQRLAPPGIVHVTPGVARPGEEGTLVDVSAGGVRIALAEGGGLTLEDAVRVEIALGPPEVADPQRIRLSGRGVIVRVGSDPRGRREIAVRFQAPLAFLDRFPAFHVF